MSLEIIFTEKTSFDTIGSIEVLSVEQMAFYSGTSPDAVQSDLPLIRPENSILSVDAEGNLKFTPINSSGGISISSGFVELDFSVLEETVESSDDDYLIINDGISNKKILKSNLILLPDYTESVTSVNGKSGVVVLTSDNINYSDTSNSITVTINGILLDNSNKISYVETIREEVNAILTSANLIKSDVEENKNYVENTYSSLMVSLESIDMSALSNLLYDYINDNLSVGAQFTIPTPTIDVGTVTFTNPTGLIGTWIFGDGTTSPTTNPVHEYDNNGTFLVQFSDSDSGVSRTISVIVDGIVPDLIPIETITVNGPTSISYQGTGNYSLFYTPSNADAGEFVWSVSDNNLASITSSGVLTTKSGQSGNLNVIVESGGVTGQISITIEEEIIVTPALTGIDISGIQDIDIGDVTTYTATPLPSGANFSNLVWSVSDDSKASINQQGTLTGVDSGTFNVIATDGTVSTYITVNVMVKEKSPFTWYTTAEWTRNE